MRAVPLPTFLILYVLPGSSMLARWDECAMAPSVKHRELAARCGQGSQCDLAARHAHGIFVDSVEGNGNEKRRPEVENGGLCRAVAAAAHRLTKTNGTTAWEPSLRVGEGFASIITLQARYACHACCRHRPAGDEKSRSLAPPGPGQVQRCNT